MKREAAVIGKPISHTLSPSTFGFLANRLGVTDFNYSAREIGPEDLKEFMGHFRSNPSGVGLNVTIPHKEAVFPLLDEISAEAQAVGAVNVVHHTENELKGYNTDVYGIQHTFQKHSVSVKDKNALIIGAGGAARAVAYALAAEGAKQVSVLAPNRSRAESLINSLQPHFKKTRFQTHEEWKDLSPLTWTLVAQSTPLGMSSQPKTRDGISAKEYFSNLGKLSFSPQAYAFDLIYRPEWTPFLDQAKKLGLTPIGGLDMLIGQALETWHIWFGQKIGNDVSQELSEYLRDRPIFLTGFMGAGKSTIGPLLAQKLGWRFIEIDRAIETEAGLSIPEIFKTQGEPYFREVENKVIAHHAFSPRSVISLGGGSLTHSGTRELLLKTGRLVFLTADLKTLDRRLKSDPTERPLLNGLNDDQRLKKIESLLKEREPFYNQAALKLDTAALSAEQAAEKIRDHFL